MNSNVEYISVNGHYLHVEVYGVEHKASIIFLHHGLGSTKSWKYQVPDFIQSGYRVILYDRWGYGKSEPRINFSMPEFSQDIDDLLEIMKYFNLNRITLIGHSDGGTISLYFAAKYSAIVSSLILVAAHIYIEEKMINGIELIRHEYESNDYFKSGLAKYHGSKSEKVFHNWYDGWMREDNLDWNMSSQLKNVICPTLVIQGSEDEHATHQHARDIHEGITNSELVLIENGAHMVLQEQPEKINPIMRNFMERIYA